ncbi:MAG: FAD-dependent oxidoreductase [Candidatus Cloacimonetes bacterium]|nr:FAD-dependent oxidoreductase [Candidatus Cloacimonadota bacterium]
MFLTEAQFKNEIARCIYCAEKPCKAACPSDCSPADFIMAVAAGYPQDFERAAQMIIGKNPLGGVCGAACPDYHCMQGCVKEGFDRPLDIPAIQGYIIQKAKELNRLPKFKREKPNGKKVAVVGAGPAGIGAAVTLAQKGYQVDILDENESYGGACLLIPEWRLNKNVLLTDIDFLQKSFGLNFHFAKPVDDPQKLLEEGFDGVVLAVGLTEPIRLNIPGDEYAVYGTEYLKNPISIEVKDKRIALVGGAIAADIALLAKMMGAAHCEMIVLESIAEMPLTNKEREDLLKGGVHITPRTRLTEILHDEGIVKGVKTKPVMLPLGEDFHPSKIIDEPGSGDTIRLFDLVFIAIGNKPSLIEKHNFMPDVKLVITGDMAFGPTTVVEAVATGKNSALQLHAYLQGDNQPDIAEPLKSYHSLRNEKEIPISLQTSFFGRTIRSPFLLSAAPPTDGYEQMKMAYEAGWAGGIMKTAFDNLPIHIPGEYMIVFNNKTYGNCDNVSDHPLDLVCEEITKLIKEYPDRLTMASTGGSVTGNDEADKQVWQNNTRKLEEAGAMGIEYSLSCPQGGDGTHGDIVSQNAELTAKIIDWVMEAGRGDIPKLFKLTGAVTAIQPIIDAIKEVFDRYPEKKAGVTLANTFPVLALREGFSEKWEKGIVVGMSGEGVLPISYLTLAKAANRGVSISGNGGPMDYKGAADFLALGAETVQFCTIVEKYGYGIIDELENGLSYLLKERNISSVNELIGIALPDPIIDFMDLPEKSKVPEVDPDLCQHCGNCTRCPYLAIELDDDKVPVIDEDKCVGCSLCTLRCFSGALRMILRESEREKERG